MPVVGTNGMFLRVRFLHISVILPICFVFPKCFLGADLCPAVPPTIFLFCFSLVLLFLLWGLGARQSFGLASENSKVYRFLFCFVLLLFSFFFG